MFVDLLYCSKGNFVFTKSSKATFLNFIISEVQLSAS